MTETTKRIIELQKCKGVNNHQLESNANLAVSSIQVWTKGKKQKDGSIRETNPSTEAIAALARYFNVSADYLLCLTDEPTPLVKEQPTSIIKHFNALSTELAELSKDQRFVDSAKLYAVLEDSYKDRVLGYLQGLVEATVPSFIISQPVKPSKESADQLK